MLHTAARLLQRHGYSATSWRGIVEQAGTPWGSAHHYFPGGKEALAVEALALGEAETSQLLRDCIESSATAGGAIRALFDAVATSMRQSEFRDGCPLATVALETAPESTVLTETCSAAFGRWEQQLVDRLRAHHVPTRRARDLATLAIASLEGALLLARVRMNAKPLKTVGTQIAALFDTEAATPR
jgi:TetR/AcrR family transcriptional regulator, lmrAB and yxaGH operons repressor